MKKVRFYDAYVVRSLRAVCVSGLFQLLLRLVEVDVVVGGGGGLALGASEVDQEVAIILLLAVEQGRVELLLAQNLVQNLRVFLDDLNKGQLLVCWTFILANFRLTCNAFLLFSAAAFLLSRYSTASDEVGVSITEMSPAQSTSSWAVAAFSTLDGALSSSSTPGNLDVRMDTESGSLLKKLEVDFKKQRPNFKYYTLESLQFPGRFP